MQNTLVILISCIAGASLLIFICITIIRKYIIQPKIQPKLSQTNIIDNTNIKKDINNLIADNIMMKKAALGELNNSRLQFQSDNHIPDMGSVINQAKKWKSDSYDTYLTTDINSTIRFIKPSMTNYGKIPFDTRNFRIKNSHEDPGIDKVIQNSNQYVKGEEDSLTPKNIMTKMKGTLNYKPDLMNKDEECCLESTERKIFNTKRNSLKDIQNDLLKAKELVFSIFKNLG